MVSVRRHRDHGTEHAEAAELAIADRVGRNVLARVRVIPRNLAGDRYERRCDDA